MILCLAKTVIDSVMCYTTSCTSKEQNIFSLLRNTFTFHNIVLNGEMLL